MIIAVDIDGVVANLIPTWLRYYNEDFQDNLQLQDIIRYEISECVKPEARASIHNYLKTEYLYKFVLPIPGALQGINILKSLGHRIVYVTQAIHCPGRKFPWLVEWGFLKEDNHNDYVEMADKSLIHADILIEDSIIQIQRFRGNAAILLAGEYQPWNQSTEFSSPIFVEYAVKVQTWDEVVNNIVEWTKYEYPL